ncbi:MAG: TetR/AcrR family transcriptional regulator [Solirubrobacterales bacterium]
MPSAGGRTQPKRRKPLSRGDLLAVALRLVDREGADALTMRRLGRELGVAAMSLYNHIGSREELLDGLSEVMVAEIGAGEADSPRAVVEQFIQGIRSVALAHPDAFRLVGMRPLKTPEAYEPVEATLGALRALGFEDDEAAHAYRVLTAYARGFALAEIEGFTFEAADGAVGAVRPSELSAERFPNVVALAPHLARLDRDPAFEYGSRAVLAGLESAATKRAGQAPPS